MNNITINNKISIICPTFKEPQHLDLCITSIIKGQHTSNEIVVVVDGTYNENKEVLDKWKDKIKPIIFEQSMGQPAATNHGVYNASYNDILIINDDNVAPAGFDRILLENKCPRTVVAPNQIEPRPSIFKSFVIHDFGQTIDKFELDIFHKDEPLYRTIEIRNDGCTLPIFMNKQDYISIGGWDESYPSGHVTDLDFFYKCQLNGFKFQRNMKLNFYHFSGVATRSPDQVENTRIKEQAGFEYFKYKWNKYPKFCPELNFKFD